jgi:hypothetical protein
MIWTANDLTEILTDLEAFTEGDGNEKKRLKIIIGLEKFDY